MRRHGAEADGMTGVGEVAAPVVHVELCRCGCVPEPEEPQWPLATAWAWLTRPVEPPAADAEPEPDPEPEHLPWWDARASAGRRRAVLPLVLLGELQAGVLLRAVWEVVQGGPAPGA